MSEEHGTWDDSCDLYQLFHLLGKKWVIFILFLIDKNYSGFNQILHKLPALSSKTLSDRLTLLQNTGLVEKNIVSMTPMKAEYTLTALGKDIAKTIHLFEPIIEK